MLFRVAACLALVLSVTAAAVAADPVLYFGRDVTFAGGPLPNANAAAAAFDAAVQAQGGRSTLVTFEEVDAGFYSSLRVGGATITSFNVFGGVEVTPFLFETWGYNTTVGGEKYLNVYADDAARSAKVTFTFDQPIYGFGGYFSGVGTSTGLLTLTFYDGAVRSYDLGRLVGGEYVGAGFFGFLSRGAGISSLSVRQTPPAGGVIDDVFGMDDLRFVRRLATVPVIPEPGIAPFALTGAALLGGLVAVRRRRAAGHRAG